MPTEITMPQLGESVTEGTITKWLVKPGDQVEKYDPIAEVMTDKVNAEIPSSYTGTVDRLIAEVDQTVEVGTVICTMTVEGDVSEEQEVTGTNVSTEVEKVSDADDEMKQRYSPAVMRLAQEHDIDLLQVSGSGKGGRITRKDIQKVIDEGGTKETVTGSVTTPAESAGEASGSKRAESTPARSEDGRTETIPVTGVRKAIAQNMVHSKQTSPHAWMMVEVDVTGLVRYRESMKTAFKQDEGFNLTFLPFFMKAVVDALKAFPQVNASWQGDHIVRYKDVHLSMAVAHEDELFVPVIRHADEKNIRGLARSLHEIGKKVKAGSLTAEEMRGGTFTLNNTGSFGSVQSQPIINQPQAAILSVESIVKRPVVTDDDAIAIRHMVNLCMSLDHRVMDGLIAGRFMAHIKDQLEQMNSTTLSI
ncbi:dihydrolipoamide acetyltransferase family protein [Salisediminibacterium selenitireducens]|uniref:Dihydrolipoamide acetyltransferase component of pyruvate dehydrogenase complex n=1 Tax=Bacillus selenitireducens (strain ATCC 700615 / DSM 15326 / MLS10) TaxID=439292 RepID=D6XVL7_BACIE|nr:dihydrolipoamide acetyltransferase family protein [Salisediminibacterium selenitireducens]ADH99755.1 catalytic domain of components of various dehydrogenase complexes [[Bacillus] selenitireducens MLS10]